MGAVDFKLNGTDVQAEPGESILKAAQRHGVAIPHLCYRDGLSAEGNCRACVVEVAGERTLAPSCCRAVTPGMEVQTHSERALKSQNMVLELLLSDLPDACHPEPDSESTTERPYGELSDWLARSQVRVRPALRAMTRAQPKADLSHPAMAVNLDACIQCTRCVRACRELQVNDVIGYARRGAHSQIVFDLDDAMGTSSCVACGECVQACPTGALSAKVPATAVIASEARQSMSLRAVDSVCPFCGVGCLLTYQVKDDRIVGVLGRDGPANQGRLCVKGRFGFDYVHHAHRLTQPLIRRADVPKDVNVTRSPEDWASVFRPATWDEALDFAARGLVQLRDAHGPKALAGFGSAKGSNEEAYLFQKLVRTGFGSNNVDHCTRLCHASSVAALLEGLGSGAVSNQVTDVEHAELALVIGSNTAGNHPVAATWIKNAVKRGLKLVVADPRGTDLSRHAWRKLQFRADTDVALVNAMIYTVLEEGLADQDFIKRRVSNFEAIQAGVQAFCPEAMAPVCGIAAETIREVARAYAKAKSAMIFWGMGISQHVHGTDNVRALIALCMVCGQIGKPGSGLHPLRGQNNVQGASDAGLIPMMFPNYQRVDNAAAHQWFEQFWGTPLDAKPGYTVVEIMHKALAPESDRHKVRGMVIMGENPAMSDPNLNHARAALSSLSHLVVQDIFMTETAWAADVVLPASAWPEKTGSVSNTDRMVQLGRQAIEPPGDARPDLWIIQQIAQRVGCAHPDAAQSTQAGIRPLACGYEGEHQGVAQVFEEMRQAMHAAIGGITWERLQREGSVTYPCLNTSDPGHPTVFTDHFHTSDGRAHLVPTTLITANELPDADYPLVLITGRQLEHWHTGSMTRRSVVLDALEPVATASIHGTELARLGLQPGDTVRLSSRRGEISVQLRRDDGTPKGTVFMPFAYREAAANLLTNAALDPFGKIPELKYCAVAIAREVVGGRH
ncbi:MAG: formate dehydrogenase subunit alpha [Rhodoferax sp.]|nr:formate dehydrogenase subunit alpha [Rhodoferax sp.]